MPIGPVSNGRHAVVRFEVRYGDPVQQKYRDLWLLRFADDGRVKDSEEWAHWPGKPHSARLRRVDDAPSTPRTPREEGAASRQLGIMR